MLSCQRADVHNLRVEVGALVWRALGVVLAKLNVMIRGGRSSQESSERGASSCPVLRRGLQRGHGKQHSKRIAPTFLGHLPP